MSSPEHRHFPFLWLSLQAVEFLQFWGERSELRRFQDGGICEAVLWDASTVSQKRLIPQQIVCYLLQL